MISGFPKIAVRAGLLVLCAAVVGLAFNAASPHGTSILREPPKPPSPWKHVSLDEAIAIWKENTAVFVDSRDKEDFRAGHISRAVNLPVYDFENNWQSFAQNVAPEMELVIYCPGGECDQSHKLAERLKQAGFAQMVILGDGFNGWKARKFPISKGE